MDKLDRVGATLVEIGKALQETGQTELANIVAQRIKDVTDIRDTLEEL